VGAALVAWMALGPHAGFGQLAQQLPILSSFRYWEKLVVWVTLLLAAAAGAGVDRLAAAPHEGRKVAVVAGAAAALLGAAWAAATLSGGSLAAWVELPGRPRLAAGLVGNAAEGTAAAGAALALLALVALLHARGALARLAPAALVALVAADLGAAALRAYVLAPPAIVSEPAPLADRLAGAPGLARVVTPFRIAGERWPELPQYEGGWRWLARTSGSSFNVPRRIGNLDAYTGMLPARLLELRMRTTPSTLAPVAALWGFDSVVVPREPALAAQAGLAPPWEVLASDRELPAYLVRQAARPRVGIAGELQAVDARGAAAFALSPGAAASGKTVVEGAVPAAYRVPSGEARVIADEGEWLVVSARADGPALLVVNDAAAPGWTAAVDGRPAPIVTANWLARGVWIPEGEHVVEMRYRTPGLQEGVFVGAATFAFLALLAVRRRTVGASR
jgi:hypothetical protein